MNVNSREFLFWYPSHRGGLASASCRYRIGNLAQASRGASIVLGSALPRGWARRTRVLLVSRPHPRDLDLKMLRRNAHVLRVGDFDDLLFAGDPAEMPRVMGGLSTEGEAARLIAQHASTLDVFDAFTVSTAPLADALQAACPEKPVVVVPNGLSRTWIQQGRALYPSWKSGDPRVVRYLPGSTHDADFAVAEAALRTFLSRHPSVRLEIVGHCPLVAETLPRATKKAFTPFEQLPGDLATAWVNLAPLAGGWFNQCKSAIKFLEAAAFGCPTIATPVPDMQRHRSTGPLFARTTAEWLEHLEALLDDPKRTAWAPGARRYIDEFATAERSWAGLAEACRTLIGERR